MGHGLNVLINLRPFRGLDHLLVRGIRPPIADILQNGVGKQEDLLLHNADGLMQTFLANVSHIHAVNGNAAAGDIVEPGNQLTQGALAAAGGAHDGNGLPGLNLQAHIVEHCQVTIIGKRHMVHPDLPPDIPQLLCLRAIPDGGFPAHDLHKPVETREAVGKKLREGGELTHGAHKGGDIQAEGNQIPVVQPPLENHIPTHCNDHHIHAGEKQLHGAAE